MPETSALQLSETWAKGSITWALVALLASMRGDGAVVLAAMRLAVSSYSLALAYRVRAR